MTDAAPGRTLRGVAFGLMAVAGWACCNVGTELARAEGFRPADLTALRFGVAALVLLPWFAAAGRRLPQWRLMLFAALVGSPFALIFNTVFQLAPLSHAVVIGPGISVLVVLALARFVDGQRTPLLRAAGLALLLAGLVAIGADRDDTAKASGLRAVLGDPCFVVTGSLRGIFSWSLARWRMPPLQATAGLALCAAVAFIPLWLMVWGVPDLPAAAWAHQAVAQGLIGGSGAPVAFAVPLAALGAGRGADFNAPVPPAAVVLMAIPVAGILPNGLQWAGVALAPAGLVPAMAGPGMQRTARPGRPGR
jgi:drug/metabolite transporter (DMT)-like permease